MAPARLTLAGANAFTTISGSPAITLTSGTLAVAQDTNLAPFP